MQMVTFSRSKVTTGTLTFYRQINQRTGIQKRARKTKAWPLQIVYRDAAKRASRVKSPSIKASFLNSIMSPNCQKRSTMPSALNKLSVAEMWHWKRY